MDKSSCVVIEKKDNNYYLETFDWTYPTTFNINAPASMKVGASGTAACSTNGGFALDYTYKSSDPKIVSVDKNGNLNAWKKGTATITVQSGSKKMTCKVTVK